jgi:hypothetical protein
MTKGGVQHQENSDRSSVTTSLACPEEVSPLLTNWSVICIGAVAPAAWTYARLQRLLHEEARLVLKDLEGYAEPLAVEYGLHREVEAITRRVRCSWLSPLPPGVCPA